MVSTENSQKPRALMRYQVLIKSKMVYSLYMCTSIKEVLSGSIWMPMKSLSRLGMKTFWEPIPRNGWWISTWPSMHLIILGICRVTIIGRHWSIIITRCAGTISFDTYINVLVTNQGVPIFNSAIIAALRILVLLPYLIWLPMMSKPMEGKSNIMWKTNQATTRT